MSKAKGLICVGIGIVALSFLGSLVFGKVLAAALLPAILGGILCTVGLLAARKGNDRTWMLTGVFGVILSVVGLILGIVHIAKYTRDAKIDTAIDMVRRIASNEIKYYHQERVGRGFTGTVLPHQFIGGGNVSQSTCCPTSSCEGTAREFKGQPWEDLDMRSVLIPNPWNFAVSARGEGEAVKAIIFAWADFNCDGEITQVSQELTVSEMEPQGGAVLYETLQKDAALKKRIPPRAAPEKPAGPEPEPAGPDVGQTEAAAEEPDSGPAKSGPVEEPADKEAKVVKARKAGPPRPMVLLGRPTIKGDLDKEIIKRVLRHRQSQIKSCYAKELGRNSKLSGKLVVKITIGPSGSVENALVKRSTLKNKTVEDCVKATFKRLRFPPPKGGGIAIVNCPLLFKSR